jgi:hypothetical protein
MRNRLTALLCLWLTTCHAVRPTPTDERTPISANPAHAPLPPPATNSTAWDPEPPAVTAALKLRGEDPEQALAALLAEAERAKTAGDQRTRAIALHRAGDLHLDLGHCKTAKGATSRRCSCTASARTNASSPPRPTTWA